MRRNTFPLMLYNILTHNPTLHPSSHVSSQQNHIFFQYLIPQSTLNLSSTCRSNIQKLFAHFPYKTSPPKAPCFPGKWHHSHFFSILQNLYPSFPYNTSSLPTTEFYGTREKKLKCIIKLNVRSHLPSSLIKKKKQENLKNNEQKLQKIITCPSRNCKTALSLCRQWRSYIQYDRICTPTLVLIILVSSSQDCHFQILCIPRSGEDHPKYLKTWPENGNEILILHHWFCN